MIATPRPAGARSIASALALALAACAPASGADDPDLVPPITGGEAIDVWFAAGHYLAWTCEPQVHDPIDSSPHGRVRTCANSLAEVGADQLDASLVLEIGGDADAIAGFATMRRTAAGSDGDVWYWYMHPTPTSIEPVADGWGFGDDPAASYCTPCHRTAGNGHPGADLVFVLP